MGTTIDMTNISVQKTPIEVDLGEWIMSHPDCDTILEHAAGSSNALVFAYAVNEDGNESLLKYRNENCPDMELLKGVSSYGIRKFF